ncbi:MAG: hypothetical protein R3A12_17245 [Ignavibacteria bacterium]
MDVTGNDIAIVGSNGMLNISNDLGSTWRNKNYSVSQNVTNFSAIWADSPPGIYGQVVLRAQYYILQTEEATGQSSHQIQAIQQITYNS